MTIFGVTACSVAEAPRGSLNASEEDVRQFRINITRVGARRSYLRRCLAGLAALRQAAKGIRHYGRAVHETSNVSLTRQFVYLASDYFFYRIGADDFYWHRLYLATNRQTAKRHFPFSQVLALQQYFLDSTGSPDYPLLRSKSMFAARCAELGLPTVPVLAEFVDGSVSPERPNLPDVDLFSKPSDRWLGLGGTLWRRKSPGVYSHAASGETLSTRALCRRLCEDSQRVPEYGGSGSIVLQERVSNHSSILGALTMGGLATIRVVTCRTPTGSFDLLPPVIRMPVGNAIADNIAQGGVAAPIDVASGRISGPAIRKDKRIGASSHSTHPSTGMVLEGFPIPFLQDVIELTLTAHKAFPGVYSVGWDVAILPNGPILLEGNAWWDSDLTVLPHGITLSDTQFVKYSNTYFTECWLGNASSTRPNKFEAVI